MTELFKFSEEAVLYAKNKHIIDAMESKFNACQREFVNCVEENLNGVNPCFKVLMDISNSDWVYIKLIKVEDEKKQELISKYPSLSFKLNNPEIVHLGKIDFSAGCASKDLVPEAVEYLKKSEITKMHQFNKNPGQYSFFTANIDFSDKIHELSVVIFDILNVLNEACKAY